MTRRQKYTVCLGTPTERCPTLVPRGTGGRCPEHKTANSRRYTRRGESVYRSKRWKGVRRLVLDRDKFCTWPDGCNEVATDVDHYPVPVEECIDPYDPDGLRGLCRRHHGSATAREVWHNRPSD